MTFDTPVGVEQRPVAVVGAGTLGRRIAMMFASRGGLARLADPSAEQCDDALSYVARRLPVLVERTPGATIGTVTAHPSLGEATRDAWLVIEAVPERLELKQTVFAELDAVAPDDAVLASNSSSYPTSRLADSVANPERLVNLHFYMPPQANAVEVMSSGRTDPAVVALMMERLPHYGLEPFEVLRESTGFIYNRIWAAIKREALAVVAEGVSTPADVDRIFTSCLGAPYGPFQMMDAVGLDVVLDIEEHYAAERDGIPEGPRELLRHYLAEGRLGAKSGRGFFEHERRPAR